MTTKAAALARKDRSARKHSVKHFRTFIIMKVFSNVHSSSYDIAAEMCDVKRRKEDWSSESDSSETESSGAPKRKKAKAVEKPKVESDDDKSSSSDDDDEAGASDADDSDEEEEEEEEESASDDADDFNPFNAGSDSDDGTRINNTSIVFRC